MKFAEAEPPCPTPPVMAEKQIAAVGRTETHALTYLLMMQNDGPFSRNDLAKLFIQAQGDNVAWKIGPGVNFGYSTDSFAESGLTNEF